MFELSKIHDLSKTIKILYVEDDLRIREQVVRMFKQLHFQIDIAIDGKDGLDKVLEKEYDIVLTDIIMPRMDGMQMIQEIKKINPDIKIIITSAYNDKEKMLSYKSDIDLYYDKPFSIPKLINDIIVLMTPPE